MAAIRGLSAAKKAKVKKVLTAEGVEAAIDDAQSKTTCHPPSWPARAGQVQVQKGLLAQSPFRRRPKPRSGI